MESSFEHVLIEALDALEAGDKVEAILARYPEHEDELRPILLTASTLANVRVAHSLEGQAASRQRFLDYAAATAAPLKQRRSLFLLLRRFALATAALLIVFTLLGTGMLFASSEAVPGDALYQAKRFIEDTRFALTGDTAAREELQRSYDEARLREIGTLLRMGRSEEVSFMGTIESIESNTWQVAGIKVVILDSTSISGAIGAEVGDLVQISGLTTDGRVDARSVIIHKLGDSLPQSTPDSDDPAETTPSPTNTATSTPTATHTPTPTEEATPSPSPAPTSQSPGNSNANGTEEGGGNDNEENSNERNGDDNDDDDNENEINENSVDNGNDSGNSNDNDRDNDNDHDNENENHNVNEEENVNNANENHNIDA